MPTYEFRCPDGTIIERIFKMSEVPDSIPSPKGDGMAMRIISGGADLIFKGSGFYITDYGKDGKRDQREAKKEGDKTAKPESKSETKADTSTPKPETKSDKPEKKTESTAKTGSSTGKPE